MPPPVYKGLSPILYHISEKYKRNDKIFEIIPSSVNEYHLLDRNHSNLLNWDKDNGWQSEIMEDQYFILLKHTLMTRVVG